MRGSTSLWCVVPFTVTLIFAIQHPSDSRKTAGSKTHNAVITGSAGSLRQSEKNCTLFCERMPQDRRDRNVIGKAPRYLSGVTGCTIHGSALRPHAAHSKPAADPHRN